MVIVRYNHIPRYNFLNHLAASNHYVAFQSIVNTLIRHFYEIVSSNLFVSICHCVEKRTMASDDRFAYGKVYKLWSRVVA